MFCSFPEGVSADVTAINGHTLYEISFLHPVNHKEFLWNEPLKVT